MIEYRSSTYRYFSPLRKAIGRSTSDPEIRSGILAVIPVGTPRQIVEQRIEENFATRLYADPDLPGAPAASHRDHPSIYIRIYSHGLIPAGSDETAARFIFDDDSRLKDIIIVNTGGYL